MSITIELTQGKEAIVDNEDSDLAWNYKWYAHKPRHVWYVVRSAGGRHNRHTVRLACLILERIIGRPLQKGEVVDFIDNDGMNCQRKNLRLATYSQNAMNRGATSVNPTEKKGVVTSPEGRYRARVGANGKYINLGTYETPEEAHAAYCKAAKEVHGEFFNSG